MSINLQKCVHDRGEQLVQVGELLSVITQLVEQVSQSLQELCVLVCFDSGFKHFTLELCEWVCVSAFASFQETQDALDLY